LSGREARPGRRNIGGPPSSRARKKGLPISRCGGCRRHQEAAVTVPRVRTLRPDRRTDAPDQWFMAMTDGPGPRWRIHCRSCDSSGRKTVSELRACASGSTLEQWMNNIRNGHITAVGGGQPDSGVVYGQRRAEIVWSANESERERKRCRRLPRELTRDEADVTRTWLPRPPGPSRPGGGRQGRSSGTCCLCAASWSPASTIIYSGRG